MSSLPHPGGELGSSRQRGSWGPYPAPACLHSHRLTPEGRLVCLRRPALSKALLGHRPAAALEDGSGAREREPS